MSPAARRVLLTSVAALAGLCLAVGLAILTSRLTTQQVGLAGESPRAGLRLVAPAPTPGRARPKRHPRRSSPGRRTTPTTSAPVVTAPAVAPAAPAPPTVAPPPAVPTPTTTAGHGDDSHGGSGTTTTQRRPHRDD